MNVGKITQQHRRHSTVVDYSFYLIMPVDIVNSLGLCTVDKYILSVFRIRKRFTKIVSVSYVCVIRTNSMKSINVTRKL